MWQSQVGCVLIDLDSGRVVPGEIQFGQSYKSTTITTNLMFSIDILNLCRLHEDQEEDIV